MIGGRPRYTEQHLTAYIVAREVTPCEATNNPTDWGRSDSFGSADPGTRQTRRASLGTADFAAAGIALAEWITKNVATRRAQRADLTLARVFARYQERHGRHVIGAKAQRVSLARC